jgi:hypothetical protein
MSESMCRVEKIAARLQTVALSAAVFFALWGTALVAVFVTDSSPHPHQYSYSLTGASVAAMLSVASLVLSLFTLCRAAEKNLQALTWQAQDSSPAREGAGEASMRIRSVVLHERLDIDPPHVCSQYAVACTCWSLCGAGPKTDGVAQPEGAAMSIVHRSGKNDCPLRFAADAARQTRAGSENEER